MPYAVKSTQEWFDQFLSNYELNLSQSSPLNDRSFLEVQAMNLAAIATSMQKFGSFQAKMNLALSAKGDYLNKLAQEYGVDIKGATQTALTATVTAEDGTKIPLTRKYTSKSTGLKYNVTASSFASGGSLVVSLLAEEAGADYNLIVSDELTISSQVPGASSTAVVATIPVTGTDAESEESIRQNTLFAERAQTGGGNLSDYRIWSNLVEGVKQSYPFTGPPLDAVEPLEPPWRSVFIEATTDIDPDGIAPSGLLDQVRESIRFKPDGFTRQENAGNTNEFLVIESITRTDIFVTIFGLVIATELEAETKAQILDAVDLLFASIIPFVEGVDSPVDKNNRLTAPYLSEVVNNVVRAQGGSIISVIFGFVPAGVETQYEVTQKNLIKNAGIAYA